MSLYANKFYVSVNGETATILFTEEMTRDDKAMSCDVATITVSRSNAQALAGLIDKLLDDTSKPQVAH